MKILIVNKFLYPNGGSETYIFKLGEELLKQGHEVQYFGMEHEGRIVGNRAEIYTSNMDFHTGRLSKLMYPFKIIYSKEAYKKISLVLDDFKPDVVHLNNFNFQLTPSVLYATRDWERKNKKRVKIIYTAHDSQLVCPNHLMQQFLSHESCTKCIGGSPWNCVKNKCIHGSFVKSLLGSIEAFIYRRRKTYGIFDLIICPSEFLKEKLDSLTELKRKTVVMHNFVDALEADSTKEDYVLYLGRFSEEKGVKTLLKVCRKHPEIKFVFAGNGPLEDEVKLVDNILNVGFVFGNKLAETVSKAKLTVFPSECNENCPFTVIESQIYGTPVLAANIGGVSELISDGVTGELFESGNEKDLEIKLLQLLDESNGLIEEYTKNCKQVIFDGVFEYTNKYINVINNI